MDGNAAQDRNATLSPPESANKKAGALAPALPRRLGGDKLMGRHYAVAGTLPGVTPAGVPPPGGVLPPPVEP